MKQELFLQFKEEKQWNTNILRDHLDMVREVEDVITPMELAELDRTMINDDIKKLKNKKAAGPDRMKAEFYNEDAKSEVCLDTMTECFGKEVSNNEKTKNWRSTRIIFIPKVKKPTAKDLRPIAITNISYKLCMTNVNREFENHLLRNDLVKDNQIGFTRAGRLEYNHFIIQYLVEKAFINKNRLILIAIDFKKAFDSIDRAKLIETLIKYKIHPHIIDTIAKVYQGDHTFLDFEDNTREKIEITSGIRQGCTVSATLFKLVTYEIMNRLEKEGAQYHVDNININSIFYADDSILISKTIENAARNLKILIEVSSSFGLHINKEKSNIIIYNCKENIEEIESIRVVNRIKYLGIILDNKRDLFKTQREEMLCKAHNLANMTYSMINKCCNNILIGKTYWKVMVLSSVLQGLGVMSFNMEFIKQLQYIENGVFRKILGARDHTPNTVLRGEIGSSLMETRFMQTKLLFVKSILEGENELLKEILNNTVGDNKNVWNRKLNDYLRNLDINFNNINRMSKQEIRVLARHFDTTKWEKEIEKKTSIPIYRRFKTQIKEEQIYRNDFSSRLLVQARSNTLRLNIEKRFTNERTVCDLCNIEEENMSHFILRCKKLDSCRNKRFLDKFKDMDSDTKLGNILFNYDHIETTKIMLECMWKDREAQLKNKQ